MRSLSTGRPQISTALLLVSCISALLGCSSQYEPEGQFWTNAAPGRFGVGSGEGDAGAKDPRRGAEGVTGASSDGDGLDEGPRTNIPLDEGSGTSSSASGVNVGRGGAGGGSSMTGGSPAAGGSPGAGGSPATGGSPAVGGANTQTCLLDVSVTTTAPGGKYRPRNVGAIWIADSSGRFVKSLDVWGNRRLSHVTAWNAATKTAGAAGNKVDAVTSATLSTHRAHNVTWDCQDYKGEVMPDDTYRVYFEVTDSNESGPNHFETFAKGPAAASVQGSAANFNGISLTFTP